MQGLQQLNEKLDLLLRKYTALQAENKRLMKNIARQTKTIETLNKKLADVEHNMVAAHISNTVGSNNDKEGMRKQLDNVINEIDKILNTLND